MEDVEFMGDMDILYDMEYTWNTDARDFFQSLSCFYSCLHPFPYLVLVYTARNLMFCALEQALRFEKDVEQRYSDDGLR